MSVKKKLSDIRRKTMRRWTQNTGHSDEPVRPIIRSEIKNILLCRPNHRLGNMLLITPLVEEVHALFPEANIDLFIKGGAAKVIFKNHPHVDRVYGLPPKTFEQLFKYVSGWMSLRSRRYDLVVNVVRSSSSGKISVKRARATHKFFGEAAAEHINRFSDAEHIAKYPVYAFRDYLRQAGLSIPDRPVPALNLCLTEEELRKGQKLLKEVTGNNKKSISLFTYATGEKRFPESWWQPFYDALVEKYPDYNVVEVLPVENVSQIAFRAPSFYSKDLREIGGFIAATEVFIGADSGMMHLAVASQTPTVGLFSVTDAAGYAPYGNGSLAIRIKDNAFEECLEAVERILAAEKKARD